MTKEQLVGSERGARHRAAPGKKEATMAADRIVTVWLDTTSDDHGWIVDTDSPEGGESETIKVFPPTSAGKAKAVAFAQKAAARRGCEMKVS